MKRILAGLLMLMLVSSCAFAWEGNTETAESVTILAPASGEVTWNDLTVGQRVTAGEALGAIAATKVFAELDGTAQHVQIAAGEYTNGTVLEIFPTSPYEVRCSVEGATQAVETTLVHIGEEVWLRCTKDGTHRAIGRITSIDDQEYTVEVLGGELYIGETVNIYRDEDFTDSLKVGYGTVIESDTTAIEASGFITRMRTSEGDSIERGQWLFSVLDAQEGSITAPTSGILTAIAVEEGSTAQKYQPLLELAASVRLTAEIDAEDVESLHVGDVLNYTRADESEDTAHTCTVETIAATESDGKVKVTFVPEEDKLPIGLSVTIGD